MIGELAGRRPPLSRNRTKMTERNRPDGRRVNRRTPKRLHPSRATASCRCSPTNATRLGGCRGFEEGWLANQQLLEAVSYELTGSLEETERYRCSVEQCAKYLNEEEGIA